jgi:hypothetical protein
VTAGGFYKVNEELNFLCNPIDPISVCPDDHICLSNSSDILKSIGIDPQDRWTDILGFNNVFECVVYLLKILTYDNWSKVMLILLNSEYQGWLVVALFTPVIVLSVIIHGLIIANYLNTALKLRNKKVYTFSEDRNR